MPMKENGCTYTWLLDGVGWKEGVDFLTPSTRLLELDTCSAASYTCSVTSADSWRLCCNPS